MFTFAQQSLLTAAESSCYQELAGSSSLLRLGDRLRVINASVLASQAVRVALNSLSTNMTERSVVAAASGLLVLVWSMSRTHALILSSLQLLALEDSGSILSLAADTCSL